MRTFRPDPDLTGFAGYCLIADIDVVAAGKKRASLKSDSNIAAAARIVVKRIHT